MAHSDWVNAALETGWTWCNKRYRRVIYANGKYLDFLPRFLMSTRPPGEEVYEMVVSGVDSVGVLSKISGVVTEAGVNFVSAHGQVDEEKKRFVHAYFCEFAGGRTTPDKLVTLLKKLPFVSEVRLEPMRGVMFEKFMFPLSSMFAGRVLNLGARAFVEMEDRLVEIFGTAGETMAYEQGKAYAESTMEDLDGYRRQVGAEWDLPNIQGLFRAEGWGVAEVREAAEGYEVTVKSAPVSGREGAAGGPGKFVVGLLVGMLRAHSKGHLAAGPVGYDAEADAYTFSIRKVKRG